MTPKNEAANEFESIVYDLIDQRHPTHPQSKIIRETMDGNTQVFYCVFESTNKCKVFFTFKKFQWTTPSCDLTSIEEPTKI